MKTFSHGSLRQLGYRIFEGCGAPSEEAALVTDVLVEASLMGLDSHGVIRYIWYVEEFFLERIKPGAPVVIEKETTASAVLDGGANFGPVAAMRAVEVAVQKAKQNHVSCVTVHNCHHVGRLGAFVEMAAREHEMICLGLVSWPKAGHFVAPWGGREGRLATNPFAYAVPGAGGSLDPLVLDMSTSAINEGKIRLLRNQGEALPEHTVLDAAGALTTDPHEFFGPPRGTILPWGGVQGFKGFGLSVLCEVLSSTLSGDLASEDDPYGQRVCFIVIDPKGFMPAEQFRQAIEGLSGYLKDTPKAQGFEDVLLPGEYLFRRMRRREKEGVPLDDETWTQIVETAKRVDVDAESL